MLERIPITSLYYLWHEAPGNYHAKEETQEMFLKFEDYLANETTPTGENASYMFGRIKPTYDSIIKHGLVNPLLVMKTSETHYVVVAGNQRLCSLKALNKQGRLEDTNIKCVQNPGGMQYRSVNQVYQYSEVPDGYSKQYGYLGEVGVK